MLQPVNKFKRPRIQANTSVTWLIGHPANNWVNWSQFPYQNLPVKWIWSFSDLSPIRNKNSPNTVKFLGDKLNFWKHSCFPGCCLLWISGHVPLGLLSIYRNRLFKDELQRLKWNNSAGIIVCVYSLCITFITALFADIGVCWSSCAFHPLPWSHQSHISSVMWSHLRHDHTTQ